MRLHPTPKHFLFTTVAFATAPLVAALSLSTIGAAKTDPSYVSFMDWAVWTFIFYGYASWFTVVFGMPLYVILRKLNAIRWWSALAMGSLVGIVVFVFIDPRGLAALGDGRHDHVPFAATGALSAFIFWVIWRQGRSRSSL